MNADVSRTGNRNVGPEVPGVSHLWRPSDYKSIAGWSGDDHQAALSCFRLSARAITSNHDESRSAILPSPALVNAARAALALDPGIGTRRARVFFEHYFQPFRHQANSGFVTGYYEPEVKASRQRTGKYTVPIYARPDDLVKIDLARPPADLPSGFEYGRKSDNAVIEYFDRAQIENGALSGRGLELFWLQSAIDVFFIHIQGSARLLLGNGEVVRISYAGKTGHPFTAIGKLLIERGVLAKQAVTMDSIRNWLTRRPGRGKALMQENRSFIFFQEVKTHDSQFGPIAGAGIQLTPGRSLAIDHRIHAYGNPVWIATRKPLSMASKPMRRLMIAQDIGSAIIGPERGDLFIGSGREAGEIAGAIKHTADFIVLLPVVAPGKGSEL